MMRKARAIDDPILILFYSMLIVWSLAILYPFYYVVINSFNGALRYGLVLDWPRVFTLENYQIIFKDDRLLRAMFVSALRVVIGSSITVFNCSMCAFALRKQRLALCNFYLILFTIPMFFGGGLIPYFLNLKRLGLYDTFWVYVTPSVFQFFMVVIFMANFREIPDAMEESATIDGANYFRVFRSIFLPMSMPVIATFLLFAGVGQWSAYFDNLYFVRKESLDTLAGVLLRIITRSDISQYMSEMYKDWGRTQADTQGIKLATLVVSVVPVVAIYPFMQRYFIKGIKIGAVKE
ncbi:MAG: carbohydrate ABC transporter permease [Spirochaetales bacterium]|nr:MAG: carbohydrate ABC transporter permease [Spirochaetales bacterium]